MCYFLYKSSIDNKKCTRKLKGTWQNFIDVIFLVLTLTCLTYFWVMFYCSLPGILCIQVFDYWLICCQWYFLIDLSVSCAFMIIITATISLNTYSCSLNITYKIHLHTVTQLERSKSHWNIDGFFLLNKCSLGILKSYQQKTEQTLLEFHWIAFL